MKYLKKVPVVLLGVIFVIMSLMTFATIIFKIPLPPMQGLGADFMNIFFVSGFVYVVKVLELVIGIMLLIPRTKNLALILIAPIVVNIFLCEVLIIQPPVAEMIPAFLVLILTVIGIYQSRAVYMPMIAKKA
jgi:putative oxidoreductase